MMNIPAQVVPDIDDTEEDESSLLQVQLPLPAFLRTSATTSLSFNHFQAGVNGATNLRMTPIFSPQAMPSPGDSPMVRTNGVNVKNASPLPSSSSSSPSRALTPTSIPVLRLAQDAVPLSQTELIRYKHLIP